VGRTTAGEAGGPVEWLISVSRRCLFKEQVELELSCDRLGGVSFGQAKSSGAEESHPDALPEPYVNLSAHTAPSIQPFA